MNMVIVDQLAKFSDRVMSHLISLGDSSRVKYNKQKTMWLGIQNVKTPPVWKKRQNMYDVADVVQQYFPKFVCDTSILTRWSHEWILHEITRITEGYTRKRF